MVMILRFNGGQPSIPLPLPPNVWEEGEQFFAGFDPLAGQNQHKKNSPALQGGGRGVG